MLDVRCLEVFPHIHHHHQLMQALVQNQQNQPIGGAPRDKRGEFLKGCPPVFSHATDPLEADDWLRTVEKELNIA